MLKLQKINLDDLPELFLEKIQWDTLFRRKKMFSGRYKYKSWNNDPPGKWFKYPL